MPTRSAPLNLLRPIERVSFELADLMNTHFTGVQKVWNSAFMGGLIWSAGGRRMRISGLEHVLPYGPQERVLLVANHRSFFDFYIIAAVVYWHTHLSKRTLFPVRSTFFYDHPVGPLLNGLMSAMSMFPPLLRDNKRAAFNRYSMERCVEELEKPGTVMGLHPEGTRNKGDDPYTFLPAQPGVGKVAMEARSARTHPIFIHGLSNSLPTEWRRSWLRPLEENPIDVRFGPEIDFTDLRAAGSRVTTNKRAADRCLAAIVALAEAHRRQR